MFQKLLTVQYLSTNNCFCCVSSNIRSLKPGSCLKLSYGDDKTAYVSLTSTTIKLNGDDCIGISSLFAKVQGIEDNAIVSATEIDQLLSISSISIVPIDRDSYEVLESFAENVQATLLDQVSVVSKDQNLVIWIGSNINAAAAIDDVQPIPLGRLNNLTEVIIKTPNDSNKKLQNNIDTNKVYNIKIQDFLTTLHDYHTILNKKILYNARPNNIESVYRLSYFNDLNSTFSKYFKPFNVFVTKSSLGIQRNSVNNILVGHLSLLTIDKLNSPTIYVRILFIEDIAELSHSEYCHSIFVNKIIFDHFSCDVGSRVVLKLLRKTSYVNEIQVFCKKNYLVDVENLFKTYLADNCCQGLVLNSEIWFDFHDNLKHYLKFGPNEAKFCVVDEDFVRNCKYSFVYENLPPVNKAMKEKCELDYFTNYSNVDEIVDCGVMVLYETSGFSWTDNLLIIGKQGTGKSTILNILKRKLNSYNIFTEVISCKYIKGKTSDSLMKLLSTIFAKLVLCQPSCLLLDDLHVVCENVKDELAQNNIYFNRISEMMNSYLNFLSRANKIHIVATAESLDKLHPQIYSSRGNHLFKNVYTISDLNKTARLLLLKHFFGKYSVSYIDFEDLSAKTEGFVIQDLVNFVNKAVFESCKDASNESEVINGDHCEKALKNTQVLSLHNVHLHDPGDKDFTNVGGLDNVKKILVESILWPVKYSSLFAEAPLRLQSGLLLYGPPGTGKTLIAGAAAKQCGLRLISIKGPELLSKYIGASEQGVRDIFYKAQSARPCILFFDEFDSLAPRRGHDNTGVTDRVVNQLLTQLDGIESLTGVCVVAATSRPDLLDPALLRPGRLDRQLLCSLPDINNRLDILTVLSKNMKFSEDADLKEVAANTDGYSGADLQSILYTAQMISVNLFSKDLVCNYDSSITNAHLAEAVSKTRPSLTAQEKAKYDRIYMQFQTGFNKDDFKLGFKTTLA